MKKATVKNSLKREANKFAGLKTPKKGLNPKKTAKREWWRRPTEETEPNQDNSNPPR